MARDLTGIGNLVPYQGQLISQSIAYCTPPKEAPRSLSAVITWADLGPVTPATVNRSVLINLQQGTKTPLDKLRGVYIDNTFSSSPVYILFPDTSHVITCPPGNTTFSPVFTNSLLATVVITDLQNTIAVEVTRIDFLNVGVNPFTNNENNEVKPLVIGMQPTANFSTKFVHQVVGQVLVQKTISMSLAGTSAQIFAAQPPSIPRWTWHITNMRVWVFGLQPSVDSQIVLQLVNNGIVRATFQADCIVGSLKFAEGFEIYNQGPMDFILDGTFETKWVNAVGVVAPGFGTIELMYSGAPE